MIRAIITGNDAYYTEGNHDLGEVEEADEHHLVERIDIERMRPGVGLLGGAGPWGATVTWPKGFGRTWIPATRVRSISLSPVSRADLETEPIP